MKAIYIVVTLWTLTVVFSCVYFAKVKELRQDLGRAVNNTEEAMRQTSECLKAGYELKELYIQVSNERDSLQKIVNNQNQKP